MAQPVKILIVGGGGREHALAWRFKRDNPAALILAAPGNPGIADLGTCVPIAATDFDGLLALARRESVTFTVVGPEVPLGAGIVDRFRAEGLPIFGPTAAAAQIEASKPFAKSLMRRAGVPTADAVVCQTRDDARRAITRFGAPVVIKASGLTAGKGVTVCETTDDAYRAVDAMMEGHLYGAAGDVVVVEEFMTGEEISIIVVTDGERMVPLVAAQDHKRLRAGDSGPNTGGMGAYAPVSVVGGDGSHAPLVDDVLDRIVGPTLSAMRDAGHPFSGFLYTQLMLTPDGPKVVEFNARFGDPEAQAVLPVLDADPSLLELVAAVATGERLPPARVRASGFAVSTVLATAGYPENPRTGDRILLPPIPDNVIVFHAGTARDTDRHLVTSGGRCLAITGLGPTIADAATVSRDFAMAVDFDGKQFRADIGWRELARRR